MLADQCQPLETQSQDSCSYLGLPANNHTITCWVTVRVVLWPRRAMRKNICHRAFPWSRYLGTGSFIGFYLQKPWCWPATRKRRCLQEVRVSRSVWILPIEENEQFQSTVLEFLYRCQSPEGSKLSGDTLGCIPLLLVRGEGCKHTTTMTSKASFKACFKINHTAT